MSDVTIRAIDKARDRAGVLAIDTGFETAVIYEVAVGARGIELRERALPAPRTKRYPIADVFAFWSTWDHAWVAERGGGGIVGVACVELEPWHRRLNLWHLYISPAHRRHGVGRALLAAVEAHGRAVGAERVWLETTNVNVPGIAAYERLGYALCGIDTTYYDATETPDEAAVYLAKRL